MRELINKVDSLTEPRMDVEEMRQKRRCAHVMGRVCEKVMLKRSAARYYEKCRLNATDTHKVRTYTAR